MRVLLMARKDLFLFPAGDTIQIQQTAAALNQMGVTAEIALGPKDDLGSWDVLHFFNLMRFGDVRNWVAVTEQRNCPPVVITPFYWRRQSVSAGEVSWIDFERWRTVLLGRARAVLVSGVAEKEVLCADFDLPPAKVQVVPVGVEEHFFRPDPSPFIKATGLKDFVFMAARISREKNQLSLLKALRGLKVPLVLAGMINDPVYFALCRQEGEGQLVYLGHWPLAHLPPVYAAARVHVLPSRYEIPGLASLEAAAAGCQVISTRVGTAREYLGEDAWYCEPGDIAGLRRALEEALVAPARATLAERMQQEYSWHKTGQKTLAVYEKVCGESLG